MKSYSEIKKLSPETSTVAYDVGGGQHEDGAIVESYIARNFEIQRNELIKILEEITTNCRIFCLDSMDIDSNVTTDAVNLLDRIKRAREFENALDEFLSKQFKKITWL